MKENTKTCMATYHLLAQCLAICYSFNEPYFIFYVKYNVTSGQQVLKVDS